MWLFPVSNPLCSFLLPSLSLSALSLFLSIPPCLQIGVVKETRPYSKWTGKGAGGEVGLNTGVMAAQLELNTLHKTLADQGFRQVHMMYNVHVYTHVFK